MNKELQCKCGFKGEIPEDMDRVVCPKCFLIYKKVLEGDK